MYLNRKSYKKVLKVGTVFGAMGVIIAHLYAVNDYWNPKYILWPFNFEDFGYGFFLGGIVASSYQVFFKKKLTAERNLRKGWLLTFIAVSTLTFPLVVSWLGLNSIIAHILPPLFVASVIFVLRRDLILPSLFAACITLVLTTVLFLLAQCLFPNLFSENWNLENLSGIDFLGIPFEELLFAFSLGLGGSHVYEFLLNKKLLRG